MCHEQQHAIVGGLQANLCIAEQQTKCPYFHGSYFVHDEIRRQASYLIFALLHLFSHYDAIEGTNQIYPKVTDSMVKRSGQESSVQGAAYSPSRSIACTFVAWPDRPSCFSAVCVVHFACTHWRLANFSYCSRISACDSWVIW